MAILLQITGEKATLSELERELHALGLVPQAPPRRKRSLASAELIIALGSAGAFTALYKVICALIERKAGRSLTVKWGTGEVNIVGHSLPEERELVSRIWPENKDGKQITGGCDEDH